MSESPKTVTTGNDDEPVGDLLSTRVEAAIADAKGVDPANEDLKVYRFIDLEGLNRLHRHYQELNGAFWSCEFTIDEFDVVVRADATVSVR